MIMSQQMYRLDLSQEVLEQIRQLAERGNRPVEAVIAEGLTLLFDESIPQIDPSVLDQFTDLQLWIVIHARLAPAQDAEMTALIQAKKLGELDQAGNAALDIMLHRLNRLTLLRSKALRLLRDRGHNVETYLEPQN
jgi:hypothetical protein